MGSTDGDDRSELQSLELGAVAEVFEDDRFPVTTQELIDEYGDVEIGHADGGESLADILETTGMETYESADDLELAILNGVEGSAVGRNRYSDRGDEVSESSDRSEQSL